MSEKKVLSSSVMLIALALAFAVSSCGRRGGLGRKPLTLKDQYEKVTVGMTAEELTRLMGAVPKIPPPVKNDAAGVITWSMVQEDGQIQKATFHLEDGKVVDKELEVVPRHLPLVTGAKTGGEGQ